MKLSVKRITRMFRDHAGYQQKRGPGTQQRWELIKSRIDGTRSLLDVGCETGVLAAAAADLGLFTLGIETNWASLAVARKRCVPNRPLAFMHFTVAPDTVDTLPTCDVVLLLSVYHHWHRQFGGEAARGMLKSLGRKARHHFFFEPASKQSKYGSTPPDFVDGDELSIKDYNTQLLAEAFGGTGRVDYLGGTVVGRSEPFRYMFAVRTGA